MDANEEMRKAYGDNRSKLCRECQNWNKEKCSKTNGRYKCPAWATACKKFKPKSAVGIPAAF